MAKQRTSRNHNIKRNKYAIKKVRKPKVSLSKPRVMKAIPGSGGRISTMAHKLGTTYKSLHRALRRPAWEDVREAIHEEKERLADVAEFTIDEMISQRLDFRVAASTARWYLERLHSDRGYQERKNVTLEGGEHPIRVEQKSLIAVANLPLNLRVQLLEELDSRVEEEE